MLEKPPLEMLLIFTLNSEVVAPFEMAAAAACEGHVVVHHYGREKLMTSGFAVGEELMD